MIQLLAAKYHKHIAYTLLILFSSSLLPAWGRTSGRRYDWPRGPYFTSNRPAKLLPPSPLLLGGTAIQATTAHKEIITPLKTAKSPAQKDGGGPTQPEMSSFKPAGADDMVNLFTGDFSYNIPLLDVGGYPVNIFYDGSVGVDQEASWVGTGWNINPGNINRNMRGIPDDFNGTDKLKQIQNMKPNRTWGIALNADLEIAGLKDMPKWLNVSAGANLGMSFNNYLGPSLDFGLKGGVGIRLMQQVIKSEKGADTVVPLKISAGLGANLNSRYGMSMSPNMSLTASLFKKGYSLGTGLSLGTTYNSRTGIKSLQISEQFSFNKQTSKTKNTSANYAIHSAVGISFAKPSYIPTIRTPITNSAFSGHFQVGGGIFGVYGSGEVEVYKQVSQIDLTDIEQSKPMVGYLYYQNAQNNQDAVMDFTRYNDKEVTSNTPIVSASQYSYDVFSIQGEGTGGSIRAYRNDHGYVRDNYTRTKDASFSLGGDIGIPGHYGANVNVIKTPSTIGEWNDGNKIRNVIGFKNATGLWENVYFRSPGEVSVLNDQQFDRIGGTDLVRFKLGGSRTSPSIEPILEKIGTNGTVTGTANMATIADPTERKKRTQVINMFTAGEAAVVGLDKQIKNYDGQNILDPTTDTLQYTAIDRASDYRKAHHISQINVTEADGRRYIYGIPVYNIKQKDFTFSVPMGTDPDQDTVIVNNAALVSAASPLMGTSANEDGYVQITETPAYAHSFLLSGLLSPDYVDVTGNGITEDDLGDAVKFNYSKLSDHKWRTPQSAKSIANFNAGNRTVTKDDKGIISYGERESWYLHSVESKNMIAVFTLENRDDAKGASNELTGINTSDNSVKRLKQIDLYNKADLKKNGISDAKPVKTVHFEYSYALCKGDPSTSDTAKGKLTLEKIYFTFNGQNRNNKNQYLFSYANTAAENPRYQFNASDRWGSFKPKEANPQGVANAVYPYSTQPTLQPNQTEQNVKDRAAAWTLKKILLPSGGQLEVEYESDDYAFVQNKRAAVMMNIAGLGHDNGSLSNLLYNVVYSPPTTSVTENDKVYIDVPIACANKQEVMDKYLQGIQQLAFKLAVNMPKGMEYVNSYAFIEDYDVVSANHNRIWVKVAPIDGVSPLALTAVEYLREQLPGQAYPGYDVSDGSSLQQIGGVLAGMLEAMKGAFANPFDHLRKQGLAQSIDLSRSFIRLNDADGRKYGGGNRVRKILMKDNWKPMTTTQYTSIYGKEYDYTTTEIVNGKSRVISSGVASYEPGIGGEENPFQTIVQVANKLPMGPASYNAVEMPVLDAFFPAPVVGYSKVTVRSLNKGTPTKKSRSGVGKQVTEFYTAKDYPVYYTHTAIDPSSNKEIHQASLMAFLYKYSFDSRALSQGFLVATNDMHGKLKSQSSYAENDTLTRINYTQNFYRNTGGKGLNEKFDFAYNKDGGLVKGGNMGIDIELMTDTREFSVKSNSVEIQGQLDYYPIIGPAVWLPFIWGVVGDGENTYRAVTTTKVITYHSILDSIVVIDKGSQVSTRNLVFDAETGNVIVSRTNNEFDKPIYNTSYPAYWAYSGMGPAYKNIDAVYSGMNFLDGKLTTVISGTDWNKVFESGDEIYLINQGAPSSDPCGPKLPSTTGPMRWVFNKNKNNSPLTDPTPDLIFIDSAGIPFTRDNVAFRVVRSGKRNMLGATVTGFTSMISPIAGTPAKLTINANSNVTQSSAIEFKEKWQVDNNLIRKLVLVYDPSTCSYKEVDDCNGYLQKNINPYIKGLIGNFKAYRNMVFYGNRKETVAPGSTNLPQNGFLDAFTSYWNFDNNTNNLIPDVASTKWVWNEQSTRFNAKGMQLETKNALDIYSAAQYGFNKSLPVAVVNNSRYNEMFYQGFEDESFDARISNSITANCSGNKHIDLSNLKPADGSSGIIDVSTVPDLKAHSGRYVLKVGANKTVYKDSIPVAGSLPDTYSLTMESDVTKTLSDIGGNVDNVDMYPFAPSVDIGNGSFPTPKALVQSLTSFSNGGFNTNFFVIKDAYLDNGDTRTHSYIFTHTYYINVQQSGTYFFKMDFPINDQIPIESRSMEIAIFGEQDNLVNAFYSVNKSSSTSNISLCKGIYKVRAMIYNRVYLTHNLFPDVPEWHGGGTEGSNGIPYSGLIIYPDYAYCNSPGWGCFDSNNNSYGYGPISLTTNAATANYKNLSTVNGCAYTKPIPATPEMLNSVFTMTASKKMLFSAWVKESCNTPACQEAYTSNKIRLQFNNGGSQLEEFTPTGPVIDGWQRIEGTFTAPNGATNATLSFINSSGSPIYYDDIRIQPFNANMKSFVYDPVNLRLVAQLDENNYATFYEYDAEGTLVRTKIETKEGIKTIQETRSFKQKNLTTFQP